LNLVDFGYADGAWCILGAMNRRPGCLQLATKRIPIAKGAMIHLGVGVCGCADVLKIVPSQRRFVGRQRARGRPACAEKKCSDGKAG